MVNCHMPKLNPFRLHKSFRLTSHTETEVFKTLKYSAYGILESTTFISVYMPSDLRSSLKPLSSRHLPHQN